LIIAVTNTITTRKHELYENMARSLYAYRLLSFDASEAIPAYQKVPGFAD
jgi:hypothetical protein